MKNTILTSLVFVSFFHHINADNGTEPSGLTSLRSHWKEATHRAISPINNTYLDELEKLKSRYTAEGNSEAALAVQSEINRLTDLLNPANRFQKFAGKWKWTDNGETITINPDGTGTHNIHGKFTVTKSDDNVFEVIFPDSRFAPLPYLFRWVSKDTIERIRLNPKTNQIMAQNLGMTRIEE